MTEKQQWTWNDGWILMAIYLSGKDQGAELYEIIAAAEAINHSIPTAREISFAFTKFLRCGIVQENEGKYSIVSDYLSALKKAYEGRGGLFSSGDKGLKWLQKAGLTAHGSKIFELTEKQMETAYDQYIKSIRQK